MRFVIVTGMSGGGKRTALKMLEDTGFYCVDNLPVPLIGKLVELIAMPNGEIQKVALGLDVRADQNFDDAQKVADYLRKNQPVVVNFEDTDSDVMKRIVDFVSGTIYALNGSMKKIGRNIMVCAPQNVDIDAGNTAYGDRSDSPWGK